MEPLRRPISSVEPVEQERRLGETVGEIVSDLQTLVRQEIRLAKSEIRKDWVRGKNALALYVGSIMAFGFAGGLALLALARGMVALDIPLGGAYTLLAFFTGAVGVAAMALSKRWAKSMTVIPDEFKDIKKENVTWQQPSMN